MYLASEAIRFLQKDKENDLSKQDIATLGAYKKSLDNTTKFIPDWVKACVAIALGLGTMIGWKRITVTVGEKIGKQHLTYGQGAAAEITAMGTIALADSFGLPVSTTHVLSRWTWVFHLIRRVIRDAIYDLVAHNRYHWFGRRDACILPNADRS